jgi:hypothetical protein
MYANEFGVTTIKEPKFLHKDKLNLEKPLCDKFYYYWKNMIQTNDNLRKVILNNQKEISMLNEKLNSGT